MRTFKLWPIVAACVAACSTPLWVHAQQAQQAPQATPKDSPPKLETLDESAEPAITIRKQDGGRNKITETRKQGKVTSVKVQTGKSTYTVKPNEPAGSALPGDAQGSTIRPPQWKVLEFDSKRKNQPQQEESDTATPPPPAAPAPSPAK